MPDYKSMYFSLFNRVTDAISLLQQAQLDGENAFILTDDASPVILSELQKGNEKQADTQ